MFGEEEHNKIKVMSCVRCVFGEFLAGQVHNIVLVIVSVMYSCTD